MSAPGSYCRPRDRWGTFAESCAELSEGPALAIADARVLRLHRRVGQALKAKGVRVLPVTAGESAKSLARVEALARAAADLPRGATVLAIGGGTVGDLATVFAHLFKRGVGRFIQVPTTALAAVDSSVGGKGAVNVRGVKNALGVFHFADEAWLCPELFSTLSEAQRREGRFEALKMAVTLDARTWAAWRAHPPAEQALIREARALKDQVVLRDPYETKGLRVVLNFGHTFGHVLETVTGFRLRHGEAVGLGMLCALDVGCALRATPREVTEEVETTIFGAGRGEARARLARALQRTSAAQVARLLAADKKSSEGAPRMVLLHGLGRWTTATVDRATWEHCLRAWKQGFQWGEGEG
ncbi:MAG: 3-dehydroquinate synthase [Myxococcales bacterium]|nr:3-dehydroquinate synthase [Myxococcales bacterium]